MTNTTVDTGGDFAEVVRRMVQQIGEIADPSRRGRAAQEAVVAVQDAVLELGQLRRTAISAMLDAGYTQADIAHTLDLSPERVRQVVQAIRRAETL